MTATLVDLVHSLPSWVVFLLVFLAPCLEASAFVGFVFPGEIAVFIGGVLAYQGRLPLAGVMAAAVAGAIIGDSIGYWVGRRYGRRLIRFLLGKVPIVRKHLDRELDGRSRLGAVELAIGGIERLVDGVAVDVACKDEAVIAVPRRHHVRDVQTLLPKDRCQRELLGLLERNGRRGREYNFRDDRQHEESRGVQVVLQAACG